MRALAFILVLASFASCNDNVDKQNRAIGSSCVTSGQCGTGKFFCATLLPGGYCKADCRADADCPAGSVCAGTGMITAGECRKSCPNGLGDCRAGEGYFCNMAPSDAASPYCDVPPAPAAEDGGA